MATAIQPLNRIALGIESTKGTLVAATRLLECNGAVTEVVDYYRSNYPVGYRSNTGGAGAIVRKGMGVAIETDLTAEEILWPLLTGIRGAVTPTGAGADKTWTFAPQLTTGIPTIDTATIEIIRSDGSTNHYYAEAGYGMTSGFTIEWNFNQAAKLSWNMFGRARQSDTPTGSLVVYTTREILVSNLLAFYLDTTWAGLGGTQLTGLMRSARLEVTTGFTEDYTLDARTDRDFVKHAAGRLTARLSFTMELDATAAARLTEYRANTNVFIRLKSTGSNVDSLPRTVQIDGAYRWLGVDMNGLDADQLLVTANLESVLDPTSTKTLEFVAINALAAVA